MSYSGVDWRNKPNQTSPINAANLEIMDNGIISVDKKADYDEILSIILSEDHVLDAEYRQGYLSNNGHYNTYDSGKSYAFDISGCTGKIYIKMQNNNMLIYGLYTLPRTAVTSSTDADYTKALWSSSTRPHEFVLDPSVYSGYQTMIVSTDYNNSTPATIVAYEPPITKQEIVNAFNTYFEKDIIGAIEFEQGNIRADDGTTESSSSRIRSKSYFPPFAGKLNTTNAEGRFYVYAYENGTYKGGYNGTEFVPGTSTQQTFVDFSYLMNKYPTYKFKVVYLIRNGTATLSNVSELSLANVLYPSDDKSNEKIRFMFNNLGGFNFGRTDTKMSTADALEKIEHYKQFYAEYQPNVLSLAEYPINDTNSTEYIDINESVSPDQILYPYIYPYHTTPGHHLTVKSDYEIIVERRLAITTGYNYSFKCNLAEVRTPAGRIVAFGSTVFDVNATWENKLAEMTKCIDYMQIYDYVVIGVDTNMLAQEEYESMKTKFENAGYQVANGGFYPLTDTCPGAVYKPIDNIFVKGRAKIKSFIVPDVLSYLASDHLPVCSDIIFY